MSVTITTRNDTCGNTGIIQSNATVRLKESWPNQLKEVSNWILPAMKGGVSRSRAKRTWRRQSCHLLAVAPSFFHPTSKAMMGSIFYLDDCWPTSNHAKALAGLIGSTPLGSFIFHLFASLTVMMRTVALADNWLVWSVSLSLYAPWNRAS